MVNVSYLFQFSYDLIDILWQLHRYSVKLYSDMVEDTKENVSPSIHTLFAQVSFHLCQPQVYSTLPLCGCLLALTMSFFSRFIRISNAYFKFRKAELKGVLWRKKALYFRNSMLSVFNAIFGHHNLFCLALLACSLLTTEAEGAELSSKLPAVTLRSFLSSESRQNLTMHELSILFLYGPKRLQ